MARQRLYNQHIILLVFSVVLISVTFSAIGYVWLRNVTHTLAREYVLEALNLAEATISASEGAPPTGVLLANGRTTVRVLSLSELRRELGLVGNLAEPLKIVTVSEGAQGVTLYAARSISGSPYVLLSESSMQEVDRILGDVMAALLVACTLLVLAALGFSAMSVRSLGSAIFRLEHAVRHFASGNLRHRVLITEPPALATFARTLNNMAAQFQASMARITQRRNELESILSSMVEGVIVLDSAKRISAINLAAAKLFDVDESKAKGEPLITYLRNSEVDDFAEETLAGEEPKERTITLFDYQPIHVQLHGTVLRGEDGVAIGALIVTSDVTRIKRLETVRREFVANVSHELRTPITSILGFVETLQEGALEQPDRALRFLDIIYAHANRLNLIIEDLLSLSRLESYEATIPVQKCQIHEIINSTKLAVAPAAMQKNIDVEDSYSGPTEVMANATLLEQAIKNLVDNAVKYSPENTVVKLSVRNREGNLTVTVSDEGVGIPAADLPRIFERFYRVDRARSRDLGGTGLGLAIVKHIAIAHGGSVNVESDPGAGSSFVLTIPQNWEAL